MNGDVCHDPKRLPSTGAPRGAFAIPRRDHLDLSGDDARRAFAPIVLTRAPKGSSSPILASTRLDPPVFQGGAGHDAPPCRLLQHDRLADTVRKLPVLFVLERARVSRAHARPDGPRWEVPIPAFADPRRPLIQRYVRAPFVACRRAPFREGNRRFPSGPGPGSHDSPRRRTVIAPDRVLSTREPGAPLGATRDPPVALRLTRERIGAFVTTGPEPR